MIFLNNFFYQIIQLSIILENFVSMPSVLSIYDPNGAWHFFEKSTILSTYVVEKKYIGGKQKVTLGDMGEGGVKNLKKIRIGYVLKSADVLALVSRRYSEKLTAMISSGKQSL